MLEPSLSAKESDETSAAAAADGTPTGGDRKQMKNRLPDLVSGGHGHGGDVKAGSSPGEGIARPKQKKNCPSDLLRAPKRPSRSDSPPSNTDGEAQATGEGPAAPSRKKRGKRMVDKDQLQEHRTSVSLRGSDGGDVKAALHGSPGEGTARTEQRQPDQPSTHGDGEASADADKGKHMLIIEDHSILGASCFGDVKINKAEGDEPANEFDPPPMDRDIEHIAGAHDSCINPQEGALVVHNYIDVNLCMDQSIPPASHNNSRSEESAWTQEKKPNIPNPSTEEKVLIDNKQEQGAEQMQGLLDLDYDVCINQANHFFTCLSIGPPMDEDYWIEYNELQLTEVYARLALYRIKDYELLSTGKELDIAELKVKYPLPVLEDNYYFKHYEESLEWYFHPEHCKMAGLDDYQRLVLHNDRYRDWDYFRLTYHTYQNDLEYVQYYDEMSKEIKWLEDKVGLDEEQWHEYDCRAFLQALKIAAKYHNIFRYSVMDAYHDYIGSIKFHFRERKDFDGVYLEIWRRVAKQKMDFHDALAEIYDQNMFPSRRFDIEVQLKENPYMFCWTSMKKNYDTYVACIDEKISEEEAHLVIIEAVKKMIPRQKSILDYVKKKLEVAARIGLVPKRSCLDFTAQGREGNREAKPAIPN